MRKWIRKGCYERAASERTAWLVRWKAALNNQDTPARRTVWVQRLLNKLGAEPHLIVDGSLGLATVAAVKAFQQATV
jgi:peptidoglycan hydrolase-like protein with peptidoglycan-binding domain